MPFIKLANNHRCSPPNRRDDGSALVYGDEWQCDETKTDGTGENCGKYYRWINDQREGDIWMPIS